MNYSTMKVAELRLAASGLGIVNTDKMKKQELIQLLENVSKLRSTGKSEAFVEKAEEKNSGNKSRKETDHAARVKASLQDTSAAPVRNISRAGAPAQERSTAPTQERSTAPTQERSTAPAQDVQQNAVQNALSQESVSQEEGETLDSGSKANGILEVMAEGFGFIRSDNYMPGDRDIYVSPAQIRRFNLKTGDIVAGSIRRKLQPGEKYQALLYIDSVNGMNPEIVAKRKPFEALTPIFPEDRIRLDYTNAPLPIRIVDLFAPIGKGQRGMIVSPPKAGKTTLLKQIAKRVSEAYPEIHLLVLLIDERPEEVTDIRESITAKNAEVIYSTFDELPEHHKRVSEMVIERAKRMVEAGKDVVILLDSLTRLARAYNLTVAPSGRTLSGGLDPAALHMPKKFFGAARNMREGGSLTILATALVDTGSRMDDVVFEEFKGTGNMELVLNRSLSEKRIFPAIDIAKSGTRKDDLLLSRDEQDVLQMLHTQLRGAKADEATEEIIKLFSRTRNNMEFLEFARKMFGRSYR
ncbi:MAG: transcription termination factor Rho [Eubacterium sp.]|nr:transcription termination factor Rho [Eubacterium sp.]